MKMKVTIASTRKDSSRMAKAGVDTGAKMLGLTGGRRSTRLQLDASCRSSVPVPRAGRRYTFRVVRFSARTRNQPTGRLEERPGYAGALRTLGVWGPFRGPHTSLLSQKFIGTTYMPGAFSCTKEDAHVPRSSA